MDYRKDIDGLRAIAVTMVLLCHLRVPGFGGGLHGVDLFFVISGFLITALMMRAMDAGSFSLIDFYRRRTVRILPPLLVMVVIVCAVGAVLLLPPEADALGRSAAATATFTSNIYFWSNSNYFNLIGIIPLQHCWSLGVEEQFYLLYPLLLLFLRRLPGRWPVIVLAALTVLSLGIALWFQESAIMAVFYLLPARGWELGVGGLVAMGAFPAVRSPAMRSLLVVGGLVLIAAASLSVFHVPWGYIGTVAGTALAIAYGTDAVSARFLSLAPMRWMGRISYPLYLWHWPLISFYGAEMEEAFQTYPVVGALGVAAATVAAATLSWLIVERPLLRRYRTGGSPGRIVAAGLGASIAVAALGIALGPVVTRARPMPPQVAQMLAYSSYTLGPVYARQFDPHRCYNGTVDWIVEHCLIPDPTRRNVVVLGDSHAAQIGLAVRERFPQHRVMTAAVSPCVPVLDPPETACRALLDRVMRDYLATGRIQSVVLAAQWPPGDLDAIAPTVRGMRALGADVTVLGSPALYGLPMPRVLAQGMFAGDLKRVQKMRLDIRAELDAAVRAQVLAGGGRYYSLYEQECQGGKCRLFSPDGGPMHFDRDHLTLDAARLLVRSMPPI